jgi:hypothetical protein
MSTGSRVARAHLRIVQAHALVGAAVGVGCGCHEVYQYHCSSWQGRVLGALPVTAGLIAAGGIVGAAVGALFPLPHLVVACSSAFQRWEVARMSHTYPGPPVHKRK